MRERLYKYGERHCRGWTKRWQRLTGDLRGHGRWAHLLHYVSADFHHPLDRSLGKRRIQQSERLSYFRYCDRLTRRYRTDGLRHRDGLPYVARVAHNGRWRHLDGHQRYEF